MIRGEDRRVCSQSVAVGVPNDKDAGTEVRGTKGGSGYGTPRRIIPHGFQAPDDRLKTAAFNPLAFADREETLDVFDEDPPRLEGLDDSDELEEESTAFARQPDPPAGRADVLAREASTDEVDGLEFFEILSCELPDVFMLWHLRPMLIEYGSAELVSLHHPLKFEPRQLQPEIQAANAAE
jgi:hypothetical protein